MSDAIKDENLKFTGNTYKKLKNTLFTKKWVVSVRDPVKRPDYVLEYLARHTGWRLQILASKRSKTVW